MDTASVKIIGCGDAFGSGGQLNTCFYLKNNSVKALIDCGASSLPALKSHKVPLPDIDAIIITHFHGDHYGGLPFVLLYLATYGQKKKLNIISPPGCLEKLKSLLALLYPGSQVLEKLEIEFWSFNNSKIFHLGDLTVESFPVFHTKEALPHGVRLGLGGKVVSYSGDTGWTDTLISLADRADLFICECCFYTMEVKGHMNYLQLREHLSRLNCKRILLTHFDKEMLINIKNIELEYAEEGMRYEV